MGQGKTNMIVDYCCVNSPEKTTKPKDCWTQLNRMSKRIRKMDHYNSSSIWCSRLTEQRIYNVITNDK